MVKGHRCHAKAALDFWTSFRTTSARREIIGQSNPWSKQCKNQNFLNTLQIFRGAADPPKILLEQLEKSCAIPGSFTNGWVSYAHVATIDKTWLIGSIAVTLNHNT